MKKLLLILMLLPLIGIAQENIFIGRPVGGGQITTGSASIPITPLRKNKKHSPKYKGVSIGGTRIPACAEPCSYNTPVGENALNGATLTTIQGGIGYPVTGLTLEEKGGDVYRSGNWEPIETTYDTIKVVMFVSDTAHLIGYIQSSNGWPKGPSSISIGPGSPYTVVPFTYWQYGFLVREIMPKVRVVFPEWTYPAPKNFYLDGSKKPLSKNIIVWQSIEVK